MLDWLIYEHKTVRSVRGTAGRSLANLEAEGWDLVSQESGAVRKTLRMRRARTRQGWLRIGGGVAAVVALVAAIGVGAWLEGDGAGREGKPDKGARSAAEGSGTAEAPATPKAPTVASSRDLPMEWDTWKIVDNDIGVDSDLYGAFDPQFWVRNTGSEPADGYFTVTFLKDAKTLGHASCTTNMTLASGEEVPPGGTGPTVCDSDDPLVRGWTEITITSGESYNY
jgi:hypothetical protein